MKTTITIALFSLSLLGTITAHADTFGSGTNAFAIDFVPIGNPGNVADTTGNPNPAGQVDYNYRMGQFEISEDMINKANTLGGLGIAHDNRGAAKPVTSISWFEAAQFVNWLNTESGSTPAYKFDGSGNFQLWTPADAGYNPNNLYRNSQAHYFLPSSDEWYKAAYYDPNGNGGSGVYFDYPTGSNSAPTAVASGTAADTAVYRQSFATGPADITQAGGLSPYGTMGQGGNVWEWVETDFDLVNDLISSVHGAHGVRGASWSNAEFNNLPDVMLSTWWATITALDNAGLGFRVASIPEPSSLLLGAMASVGLLMRRKRPN